MEDWQPASPRNPSALRREFSRMARVPARRQALARLLGAWAAALGLPGLARAVQGADACVALPEETAGPYPANGAGPADAPNVLSLPGIVRNDLRASVGGPTGVAGGAPLRLTLKLADARNDCIALPGRAVYLWHCTQDGGYSLYTPGLREENFLRGVQVADANGEVTFQTIFPGCYPGRYPHLHIEVYQDLERLGHKLLTSQLALPSDACGAVYGEVRGYEASLKAYARTSLERDGIFADSSPAERAAQTLRLQGDPEKGYAGHAVIGLLDY